MDNQDLVNNWQQKIIDLCESKLDRELNLAELQFIRSKNSFLGLEFIEAEVSALTKMELQEFLDQGVTGM
jgi:hypothetical protein